MKTTGKLKAERLIVVGRLKSFQYESDVEEFYICLPPGLTDGRYQRGLTYRAVVEIYPDTPPVVAQLMKEV